MVLAAAVASESPLGKIAEVKFTWNTDEDGSSTGVSTNTYDGVVLECIIIPGTGSYVPTDLFDVVVTDENGVDVLHGYGANLSNVNTTVLTASLGAISASVLTIAVSNAGSGTRGTAILHIA